MNHIYTDDHGNYYGVSRHPRLIRRPESYGVFISCPGGRMHPYAIQGVGVRRTYGEAQTDLDRIAHKMGWRDVSPKQEAA